MEQQRRDEWALKEKEEQERRKKWESEERERNWQNYLDEVREQEERAEFPDSDSSDDETDSVWSSDSDSSDSDTPLNATGDENMFRKNQARILTLTGRIRKRHVRLEKRLQTILFACESSIGKIRQASEARVAVMEKQNEGFGLRMVDDIFEEVSHARRVLEDIASKGELKGGDVIANVRAC